MLRWAQRLATSRQLAGCVGSARGCSDGAVRGHRSGHGFCNFIASVGIHSLKKPPDGISSSPAQWQFHQTRLGAIAHGFCNFTASAALGSIAQAAASTISFQKATGHWGPQRRPRLQQFRCGRAGKAKAPERVKSNGPMAISSNAARARRSFHRERWGHGRKVKGPPRASAYQNLPQCPLCQGAPWPFRPLR